MKLLGNFIFLNLVLSFALEASPLKVTPKSASEQPAVLSDVGITENLGAYLDLNLQVTDDRGEQKTLGEYFNKGKPVLLSLVYYNCPGLCSLHLNGLVDGLKEVNWSAGQEFEFLTLSFDSNESYELGTAKKANYLNEYKRVSAKDGWHFLTASEEVIKSITTTVGFQFKWEPSINEWAHASAAIFISPEGKVSRYLHGVMFEPDQLRLALSEASAGRVGTVVDKLIWYCFRYDPQQSKYVIYAFRLVQLGGGLIILILALLLMPTWLRERKKKEQV